MKTFRRTEPRTVLDIWFPRYSSLYATGERVALLSKSKVDHATPWLIINFTKAKHLQGQRFCIKRVEAQECPLDSNGTIPCYAVAMSKLQPYDTAEEVKHIIDGFGW